LLDRTGTGYKKLVQKKDLLSELKQLKPEILLTLGAGDIDQFVAPITEFFSSEEDK
jgi:UDP-N-acetylmuramate--alanine ligase